MFSAKLLFVLLYSPYILCLQRQLCQNDEECLINAVIERVYPRFVAGMPGVETSDPLRLDAIIADLPTIRYALFNVSMTGLKDCYFVQLDNKRLSTYTLFDYAVKCPELTVRARYDLNGIVDSEPVEGKGEVKIVYEDYHISISGKHEKVKDDKGRHHINIVDYTVTPDLSEGKVKETVFTNLVFSNLDTCDNRVKIIEELTRDVVIDVFMTKYIQNLKDFHHQVPVEDLHFKYVR